MPKTVGALVTATWLQTVSTAVPVAHSITRYSEPLESRGLTHSTTEGFASESHLLKLQRLQNKVLRTIGSFPRRTSVRDMHAAFQIPYVYDYTPELCR
jgi:hypothetical protein